jgi:hypothetical protein
MGRGVFAGSLKRCATQAEGLIHVMLKKVKMEA